MNTARDEHGARAHRPPKTAAESDASAHRGLNPQVHARSMPGKRQTRRITRKIPSGNSQRTRRARRSTAPAGNTVQAVSSGFRRPFCNSGLHSFGITCASDPCSPFPYLVAL